MLEYEKLPNNLGESVKLYVENKSEPGSFIMAVLENDLTESFARADDTNRECMNRIVQWFYWEMPNNLWGSREKVIAHLYGKEND